VEKPLRIETLVPGGDGLARDEGQVVFVPLTVPGDLVRASIETVRGIRRGRVLEILEGGAQRQFPPCPVAGVCGGCDWQQVSLEGQLLARQNVVRDALARIGGIAAPPVVQTVPSPRAWRYRRRARVHQTPTGWGFARFSSHDTVDVASCLLLEPEVERLVHAVSGELHALRLTAEIPVFAVDAAEPRLAGIAKGAAYLESRGPVTNALRRKVERLLDARIPGLVGVVLASQDRESAAPALFGQPVLVDAGHRGLRVRPDLFAQANRLGARLLAEATASTVEPGASVLEVFAGAGTLTLHVIDRASRLVATEGEGPSLDLLRASLKAVGKDARLIAGQASQVLRGLIADGERFDHLLLDPPRVGAKDVLALISQLARTTISYVSCDPATFARDAGALTQQGWQLESVTPFDLFPQTHHVELLAVFRRK
jgi:23S rRNA (uracil1939-C5)-methyltransferase